MDMNSLGVSASGKCCLFHVIFKKITTSLRIVRKRVLCVCNPTSLPIIGCVFVPLWHGRGGWWRFGPERGGSSGVPVAWQPDRVTESRKDPGPLRMEAMAIRFSVEVEGHLVHRSTG